jgi:hypothetical protein
MNDEMEAVVAWWQYYLAICLEGLRKTMKALNQDNWCPSLYSNRIVPKYKTRVWPLYQWIKQTKFKNNSKAFSLKDNINIRNQNWRLLVSTWNIPGYILQDGWPCWRLVTRFRASRELKNVSGTFKPKTLVWESF